jgi:hypothetical protein
VPKITKLCFGFEIFWRQNVGKKSMQNVDEIGTRTALWFSEGNREYKIILKFQTCTCFPGFVDWPAKYLSLFKKPFEIISKLQEPIINEFLSHQQTGSFLS